MAKLVGSDAPTLLTCPEVLVDAVTAASERYCADGVCSAFDLQAEAEALGCTLHWPKNNPPAVTGHILAEGKTLRDLPEFTREGGRLPLFFEATRKLVERLGDRIAVFALCCGPFTLALHLRGSGFIMDMIKKPDEAHQVLQYCAEITRRMGEWYLQTGAHVIAVVDPMTSQICPEALRDLRLPLREARDRRGEGARGASSPLFCCGNATKNIELMMRCAPDAIAFDEQVDLAFVRDLAHRYQVCFEGNIPLTTTLLFGSPRECVEDVKNRIATGGNQGYILSPGCDLPLRHPPSTTWRRVGRYVAQGEEPADTAGFLSLEEALQQAEESGETFEDVPVEPGKVFVEIVTLDSEGCAPCQYMCEAVKNVAPRYPDRLRWRESLIKSAAGIRRTMALGVSTLPTLLHQQRGGLRQHHPHGGGTDQGNRQSLGLTAGASPPSGGAPTQEREGGDRHARARRNGNPAFFFLSSPSWASPASSVTVCSAWAWTPTSPSPWPPPSRPWWGRSSSKSDGRRWKAPSSPPSRPSLGALLILISIGAPSGVLGPGGGGPRDDLLRPQPPFPRDLPAGDAAAVLHRLPGHRILLGGSEAPWGWPSSASPRAWASPLP